MTCDLQAIRERDEAWDGYEYDMPNPAVRDRRALLAEIDRLRAAIEQHREQVESWNIVNREPAPADGHLWAALENNDG